MASDILIVDDELDIRELVAGILQDEGHGTRTARDSDEALADSNPCFDTKHDQRGDSGDEQTDHSQANSPLHSSSRSTKMHR